MNRFENTDGFPKLIFRLSYPLIFAMLFQASYTIIDTIYVGRGIGLKAIGGISIAMPFILIIMAITFAVGVGSAVLISQLNGGKKFDEAKEVINTVLTSSIAIGIVFTLVSTIFANQLIGLFTNDTELSKYSVTFLRISGMFILAFIVQMGWSRLFLAEGRANVSSTPGIAFVISNVVLGYVAIFVLKQGMTGLAIASGLSQVIAMLIVFFYMFKYRKDTTVKFHKGVKAFSFKSLGKILKYGIVPFIRNAADSIFNMIIIYILKTDNKMEYIPIVGIVARLVQLTNMPSFGVMQGANPLLGYNYGAKQYDVLRTIFKITCLYMSIVILSLGIIVLVLDVRLVSFFSENNWAVKTALTFFTLQLAGSVLQTPALNTAFYFQTRGMMGKAIVSALFTTIIITTPVILILRSMGLGPKSIYIGQSIGYILSSIIGYFMTNKDMKYLENEFKNIENENDDKEKTLTENS